MQYLELKPSDIIRGESTTAYIADRGFSPASYGLNLTKERGVVYFPEVATDMAGATLTENLIASAKDSDTANDMYFLGAEGGFYRLNASTFTKDQTGVKTYALGTSDLINFGGSGSELMYATSQTGITQLGLDFASINEEWWTGFTNSYRHPMEKIEGELFIADGNIIYYWNGASSGIAFTLPTLINVTSLRRHPDGRTLLAFAAEKKDYSHTVGQGGLVYYCDPNIRDWTREVAIEAQVEGTRLHNGVVYCTWGRNFGYFTGDGLSVPLKRFDTSTTTYSHSIKSMDDILITRDGPYVLAFGDLGAGNVWWKIYYNGTQNLSIVANKGDNVLLFGGTDGAGAGTLKEVDLDNSGANGFFKGNRVSFGQDVIIRRVDIYHDITNAAGTSRFFLYYMNDQDSLETLVDANYVNQSLKRTRIETAIQVKGFWNFFLAGDTGTIGFRSIRIAYDPLP